MENLGTSQFGSITMQAIRFHEYGGPGVLVVDQVPVSHPQDNRLADARWITINHNN
jgi:NADPH:quinone reductase-like Zn-dependent oxidoreductase